VRLLGPLAAAAALAIGALPALAQTAPMTTSGECSGIRFELANPDPGSMIEPGGYVVQGVAMDQRATQGPGIDHIDFFLDSREEGGLNIGSAVPGMTTGPFGPDSFQTTLDLPDMIGGHDLVAYAHSAVNGAESVISVPIAVGEYVSKAFASAPPETASEMCMGGSTGAATSTTTTTPATTTTAPTGTTTTGTSTTATSGTSTVEFQVANPSPGDTIHVGAYVIEGTASDTAAQQGNGIDRIDIFLDSRDEGGTLIGHGSFGNGGNMWTATVDLPKNDTGVHSLFFYAHSSVSGKETVVEVPAIIEE
jgi:3D (Asp-Asp-Asp) domain-containing protein